MLKTKDIILRDFIEKDIDKRIYWEKAETEWHLWDAPWEYDGLTEPEKKDEFDRYVEKMYEWVEKYQHIPKEEKRYTFQIDINDERQKYIGWVSAYKIDDEYNYTDKIGHCAVGIDIPDRSARGKGYSYQALCVFVKYLLHHEENEIFTQTWSGNERMIHIAEKIGFEECYRKKGIRSVRGGIFDGLTYKLNMDSFNTFCEDILF